MFFLATGHAGEKQGPQLTFATNGYDYATLYLGEITGIKTLEIVFSNSGAAPLLLSNVRACCGTRVSDWTRQPVLPGENGKIVVKFRVPSRPHTIRRSVSIESNCADNPRMRFNIRGNVKQKNK